MVASVVAGISAVDCLHFSPIEVPVTNGFRNPLRMNIKIHEHPSISSREKR
jgi:hypothetical protein